MTDPGRRQLSLLTPSRCLVFDAFLGVLWTPAPPTPIAGDGSLAVPLTRENASVFFHKSIFLQPTAFQQCINLSAGVVFSPFKCHFGEVLTPPHQLSPAGWPRSGPWEMILQSLP